MKRLLLLILLTPVPGCVGFEESYYEDFGQEWMVPASADCPTQTVSAPPAASAIIPAAHQTPAVQTREPDLAQPKN